MAIETIEGRSDDVLRFQSKHGKIISIFPDFFRRAIIFSNKAIRDYMLIQTDVLELKLFIDAEDGALKDALLAINTLLESYEVTNIKILSLHKHPHQKGNKLIRIKNERKLKQ